MVKTTKKKLIKKKTTTKKEAVVLRSPRHRKFYVTNVIGGLTDQDFRFELLNEKVQDTRANSDWNYIADAMIILSPVGAKRLFQKLKKYIEIYENEKGIIQTDLKDEHTISAND